MERVPREEAPNDKLPRGRMLPAWCGYPHMREGKSLRDGNRREPRELAASSSCD